MLRLIGIVWRNANAYFRVCRYETEVRRDQQSGELTLIKIDYEFVAPDVIMVLMMFVFAVVYYGALSLPVVWLQAGVFTLVHWPAVLILATNSSFRFVLKYRERSASLLDWTEPVGRERRVVWLLAVLVGLLAGLGSGLIADSLVTKGSFSLYGMVTAGMLGIAEMIWNGKRIGGGALYDEVEQPEVVVRRTKIHVLEGES